MKIGVISDTHGCVKTWREVFSRHFSDADLILHAGDVLYHGPRNAIPAEYDPKALVEELNGCPVPMIIACGNCDAEVDAMVLNTPIQAPYAYVFADGRRIVMNHGHHLDEKARWETAGRMKAALLITGHTHEAALEKRDGIVWLNPGSPAMTKRPDGRGTIGIIEAGKIEIVDVQTGEVIEVANF
ncbi:MAG: phosphodiesterase [Negativicutes bacterium]|nr:phosphodiesterase [Negativicutes bacterium]